jgi:ubiquinone/menaquinone biosynthesis C-methylase UbiE
MNPGAAGRPDVGVSVLLAEGRVASAGLAVARAAREGAQLMPADEANRDRWRRYWNKHSASYDKQMRFFDRVLFTGSRTWVCSQATGDTLEVAIGTGLNLPLYPRDIQLTGIDLSPAMLGVARQRAGELGRAVDLREADAHALPFPDACFDTVVCTFSLCAIPDERRAVSEMKRVLRPGGLLLLADHIAAATWPVRVIQRLLEVVTVPLQGEHFLRRPLRQVQDEGLEVEKRERFKLGLTEQLAARKPASGQQGRGEEASATGNRHDAKTAGS